MKNIPMGTIINIFAIVVGSIIGIYFQQYIPLNLQKVIFQALGLVTLTVGFHMLIKMPEGSLIIFAFSLIVGGIIGYVLGLENAFHSLSESVKSKFGIGDKEFTNCFITTSLLFCVGAMSILGPIEESSEGKKELLIIKSMMDGTASVAFASTCGWGVLFSVFPVFLFQGSIFFLANWTKKIFSETVIGCINAIGGILIIGIGINLLKITRINIETLLPSIIMVLFLSWFWENYKIKSLKFRKFITLYFGSN